MVSVSPIEQTSVWGSRSAGIHSSGRVAKSPGLVHEHRTGKVDQIYFDPRLSTIHHPRDHKCSSRVLGGNLLQHQREPLIYASVATAQTLKTPLRRLVLLYGEANRRQIFCREQSSSGENLPSSSARGQSLESLKGNPWPWARAGALFRNQNSRE